MITPKHRQLIRTRAIAFEAFKLHLSPERLGTFTDEQWAALIRLAEAEGATAEDCNTAVDYLRVLLDARVTINHQNKTKGTTT